MNTRRTVWILALLVLVGCGDGSGRDAHLQFLSVFSKQAAGGLRVNTERGQLAGPNLDCWLTSGNPADLTFGPLHWRKPDRVVPVFLKSGLAGGIEEAGYEPGKFVLMLQTAIERWNADAGMNVRFRFESVTTADRIEGGVLFVGSPDCSFRIMEAPTDPGHGSSLPPYFQFVRIRAYRCLNPMSQYADRPTHRIIRVIMHELGHALGRNDAYGSSNECQLGGSSLMAVQSPLAPLVHGFDKKEAQAVYGRRPSRVVRRVFDFAGGGWQSSQSLPIKSPILYRSGSSDGLQAPYNVFAFARGDGTILKVLTSFDGVLSTESIPARGTSDPVSTAMAPSGETIMAFVRERPFKSQGRERAVCYLHTSSWGQSFENAPVQCLQLPLTAARLVQNGVSAAYDPASGHFLIAANLLSFVIPTPRAQIWLVPKTGGPAIGSLYLHAHNSSFFPADAPQIACADNPGMRWNCVLVGAGFDVPGQPLQWARLAVENGQPVLRPGSERTQNMLIGEGPSVKWANGRFHLAFTKNGNTIRYYNMAPREDSWTYRGKLNDEPWVSAPTLSEVRYCWSGVCRHELHATWLQH